MAIVANQSARHAVSVYDPYTAERAVASNNAQIITMGSQITGPAVAKKLIDIWLESEFQGGRSAPKDWPDRPRWTKSITAAKICGHFVMHGLETGADF
ncbi:MAG: RpiB/LacA/LacB family sugar-phosphate isomerase [Caldilineaceae bacterium]